MSLQWLFPAVACADEPMPTASISRLPLETRARPQILRWVCTQCLQARVSGRGGVAGPRHPRLVVDHRALCRAPQPGDHGCSAIPGEGTAGRAGDPLRDDKWHGYYLRNWAAAEAVLGERAPERLRNGVQILNSMAKGEGMHQRLFDFLEREAPRVAREILSLSGSEETDGKRTLAYLAEMILGIDSMIWIEPIDPKAGEGTKRDWTIRVTVRHPFAGRNESADEEAGKAWAESLKFPMEGNLVLDGAEEHFGGPIVAAVHPSDGIDWRRHERRYDFTGTTGDDPFALTALVAYSVNTPGGTLEIAYDRPIIVDKWSGEPFGSWEKEHSIANDRKIRVRGRLHKHQSRMDGSFVLDNGIFMAATTQGKEVPVSEQGHRNWLSPRDRTLLAGSLCEFEFSSGWTGYEGRIAGVTLLEPGMETLRPVSLTFAPVEPQGEVGALFDGDVETGMKLTFPDGSDSIEAGIGFDQAQLVRAIDLRQVGSPCHVKVEAETNDGWQSIYWGQVAHAAIAEVVETRASRLRLTFTRRAGGNPGSRARRNEDLCGWPYSASTSISGWSFSTDWPWSTRILTMRQSVEALISL